MPLYELLKIGLNHGTNIEKSNEVKFILSAQQVTHRDTLCDVMPLKFEDLLQEGYDFVTTTKIQRDSYLSGGCFPVSHRNIVCVVRKKKNPQAQKSQT